MWSNLLIHAGRYLGLSIFNFFLTRSLDHLIKGRMRIQHSATIYDIDECNPIPDIYGTDVLKALLTERQFLFNEVVSLFETEAQLSFILGGQEELTTAHIQKLSNYFCVSPLTFFPKG